MTNFAFAMATSAHGDCPRRPIGRRGMRLRRFGRGRDARYAVEPRFESATHRHGVATLRGFEPRLLP
jgi:hypothetical protein